MHGVYVVYAWCIHGVCMVYTWCMHGVYVVYVWCIRGVCMVYTWCTHGVYVVYAWSVVGVCVLYAIRNEAAQRTVVFRNVCRTFPDFRFSTDTALSPIHQQTLLYHTFEVNTAYAQWVRSI